LGGNVAALWGLCQGSGKEPYRTQIDLAGPAFKCSCPSRKFPCKHGLGLYLLYAKQAAAFADASPPDWVGEWLQSREQRQEKTAAKATEEVTPEQQAAKEKAQQKRQDQRAANVAQGLALLDTWLADLAREGVAGLRGKSAAAWDAMASRMVDAQVPGVAARIRRAGNGLYASSAPNWEMPLARELAQLALLVQCHTRLEPLPPALQADVRSARGFAVAQEEVLAQAGVADIWLACGNRVQEDERITRRACYLIGQNSGRLAVIWQFATGGQHLEPALLPGLCYAGTLHFYPSATPLRALFTPGVTLHQPGNAATGAQNQPAVQEAGREPGQKPTQKLESASTAAPAAAPAASFAAALFANALPPPGLRQRCKRLPDNWRAIPCWNSGRYCCIR
jgi:hypothetical protein